MGALSLKNLAPLILTIFNKLNLDVAFLLHYICPIKQQQIFNNMNTQNLTLAMIQNIDSHFNRTMRKEMLNYDKKTLNYIIEMGYVSVRGNEVTRQYHGMNYEKYV